MSSNLVDFTGADAPKTTFFNQHSKNHQKEKNNTLSNTNTVSSNKSLPSPESINQKIDIIEVFTQLNILENELTEFLEAENNSSEITAFSKFDEYKSSFHQNVSNTSIYDISGDTWYGDFNSSKLEKIKNFCKKHLPFLLSKETDEPEDILNVLLKTHHNITTPGYETSDNNNKRTFVLNKKDFKKMHQILNEYYPPKDGKVNLKTKISNYYKKFKDKRSKKRRLRAEKNLVPIIKTTQNDNYSIEIENCKKADEISIDEFLKNLNDEQALKYEREEQDYYFTPRLDQVRTYYQSIH
ncbi:hypothetical protein KGF54_005638 [Candida jiufengensis]|uniref:uncharacterized protein n=1 Tax=Candida jiufengensis TaxID=497108 RepID=UPI002224AFE7|nr:uncharacterized protein KGF54_005638 [Candida jiufengensis]KAI5949403.1 hypothetical protein KGF54_005638 [Candida jiufengensis]